MSRPGSGLWRKFYQCEQMLFAVLNSQCKCLYSAGDDELKYNEFRNQQGTVLCKPPRFVHWIGHFNEDWDEVRMLSDDMKGYYYEAVGKSKFSKYPARFPVFYSNVEQINVTQNRAFSSVQVDGDFVDLKTYSGDSDATGDIESLRASGFTAVIRDETFYRTLSIPVSELFTLAGTDRIQVRRPTGIQYRAVVRKKGETRGVRSKLGIMLIDKDSDPSLVFPHPEAPRPHSLAATGTEISVPLETPFQFYAK